MKLYIGPYLWQTNLRGGSFAGYVPPAWAVGDSYDLRSIVQCAERSNPRDALWLGPDTLPPGNLDYQPLGNRPDDALDASAQARLDVQSRRLGPAIIERLIESADDTNTDRNFPVTPGREGRIRLPFGLGPADGIVPDRDAPWWPTVRRAMKRMLLDAPEGVRRKMLSVMLKRNLRQAVTRENAVAWLDLDEEPQKPSTTLTDNFNRADSDLAGSTASGGGTWSEPDGSGAWTVLSNQVRCISTAGNDAAGRLDSDLSSADHYCQMVLKGDSVSAGFGSGPAVRFSPSAQTQYYLYFRGADGDTQLWKQAAGSHAQLGSNFAVDFAVNDIAKLEASGSGPGTITLYKNGASQGTRSDSSISGIVRCGMYGFLSTGNTMDWDDWEASDAVGGGGTRGMPFGTRGTAFNGGRTWRGAIG